MGRRRAWTDDQLRVAVATSTSLSGVVRRLRRDGGAGYDAVKRRIFELGLDTSHFAAPFGPPGRAVESRRWSDEQLAGAVETSTTLNQVFGVLGLIVGGSQWIVVRERIEDLGLDTSHWRSPLGLGRRSASWTDDELRAVVPEARSFADVLRRLGASPTSGSTNRQVRDDIRRLDVDVSHFAGQGWARGTRNPAKRPRKPLNEILVAGRHVAQTSDLRKRLVEEGILPPICAGCGRSTWEGRPIPLELDHINGDRRDNRLENLRLLCPNCHALTETYRGRNIGRYDSEPGQRR